MGACRRSPLRRRGLVADYWRCSRNAWRWLRRQFELELMQQKLLVGIGLGVSGENQCAAVRRRKVHVEHLDGGHLVEHGARRETGSERLQAGAQRDLQAIGHESDEDVRLDTMLELMIDRPQLQIVLEVLDGGTHLA